MHGLRHLLSVGRGTVLVQAYDTDGRESSDKVVHVQNECV